MLYLYIKRSQKLPDHAIMITNQQILTFMTLRTHEIKERVHAINTTYLTKKKGRKITYSNKKQRN